MQSLGVGMSLVIVFALPLTFAFCKKTVGAIAHDKNRGVTAPHQSQIT